ncbi:MAG TPA: helix-turn-helix domain-containing protein [Verrucomicrobiae bacterium]|jgi:transcriptional regulator with XRE-family HTH domain|nr:helix-turn-helix domain-containing protein [Verrucomicrobiae bacterium]
MKDRWYMRSLSEQLRNWRSRHRLSKPEAATALDVSPRIIDELERGVQSLPRHLLEPLFEKLSKPPSKGIRGAAPDPDVNRG